MPKVTVSKKAVSRTTPIKSGARLKRVSAVVTVKATAPAKLPGKRGPKVDVQQTERRKREIVEGAARLFDRVGYHGVNMSMIAEAAGVKKPTLYHYIKGKDEILFMLHELFIGTLQKNTNERVERGANELEILRGVIGDTFQLLHDYPGYMRAFFEHTRELDREQRAVIAAHRDEYVRVVVGIIEKAMSKKMINRADPLLTAHCLFAISNWPYQWYRPAKDPAPDVLAEQSWQIFLRGLATR